MTIMGLAWNIITTLSARIIVLVLALLSSIILARTLGPDGLGLFALILLLPELARTFGLLGFDQANAVYAGLEPDRRRVLMWQSLALSVVVGGVLAVSAMGYVTLGAPGFRSLGHAPLGLMLLALSAIPVALAVAYCGAILRGMNKIFLLNIVEVGSKLVSLLLVMVFVVWLRFDVAGAVLANVVLTLGTLILMVVLLRYLGLCGKLSFDRSLWKRTARFALPAYFVTLMSYLNYRVDQFIIAIMLPSEQLGLYVIAVALGERLWILTGSVANALLPHLTNSKKRDPLLSAVIARHVLIWTGAGCLVLFLLADAVIQIMYSSAFVEAVAPLRWLLPGVFVASSGKVLVAELLARHRVDYLVQVTGFTASVNIIGNLMLVPIMGISGAALASTVSYTLLSIMVGWFFVRETHISWNVLVPRWSDFQIYSSVLNRYGSIGFRSIERVRRAQP